MRVIIPISIPSWGGKPQSFIKMYTISRLIPSLKSLVQSKFTTSMAARLEPLGLHFVPAKDD